MDSSFSLTTVAAAVSFFTLLVTLFFLFGRKFRFRQPNITPDASLSPPPQNLAQNWKHHVFPSFHGADVRKGFLSHILKEFRRKGIHPFIDNDIERSRSIGPELIDAIRGSRIAIVLLSKKYASSTWCMNELVEIVNCRKKLGQTVMTIFYEVDPTDVKKQRGDFGKAFRETCKGKSKEDIGRWRHALVEVAKIAGYHSSNWAYEADMIEDITTDVSNKLFNSTPCSDFEGLVGMITHMEKIERLLLPNLDEVRMIGILGPSGIGKTTIARSLFSRHSENFQLSVFMENIKSRYALSARSDDYGAKLYLQEQFINQITDHCDTKITHLETAKHMLQDKKVLLVLDDVDQLIQLEAMAKQTCWFGPWSRIIITTQDQKLLKAHEITHIYKVDFPPMDEALEMFFMYAFSQKSPKDGFWQLALEVTEFAGKLPLGLRVLGSHFKGMSKQDWAKEVPRLRNQLNGDIESILKFSYDSLCDEDKFLFLHIACFFNGDEVGKVKEYLANSFSDVTQGLHVLAEKSLISMEEGCVNMHNLLQQLGREIVRKKSIYEPRQRQFLVDKRDICEVFSDDTTGSSCVVGIYLSLSKTDEEIYTSERVWETMSSNLQFLRIYGGYSILYFPQSLNKIFRKLRLLSWEDFPMTYLPTYFYTKFLIQLDMRWSKLEKLWDGIRPLRNLKWMDLSHSENLKECPDLSTATNLYDLILDGCSSLVELPSSIGNATNLTNLNLSYCSSLVELPSSIGNATNLGNLDLSYCSSLVDLPSSIGNATNLEILDLSYCSSLVELPSSIGNATNLKRLDLSHCSSLVELPSSIRNATNLENLELSHCSSLVELPASIGNATNLKRLDLSYCSNLVELPSSIGNATNLEILDLNSCSSLVELPSSIGNATNLEILDLNSCSSLVELPSSIGNATNLKILDLSYCSSLVELPSSIGNATNLEILDLNNCSSLVELPSSIGNATNLKRLDLSYFSNLVELPSSIGNATNLKRLNLSYCSSLVELPSSIGNATNIQNLELSYCSSIVELPSSIGNATNLQNLKLSYCSSLVELPSSIGNATNLKNLNLSHCSSLVELPSSIGNAPNLEDLKLSHCSSLMELPSSIGNLQKLRILNLQGCSKLEVLPTNINLESLNILDLTGCSLLQSFPEISTSIQYLRLIGTSIKEVPSSIRLWSRLEGLHMSDFENLKEFPHAFERITELHMTDTETQELGPWVKGCSRLHQLVLRRCRKLRSLPQLSDSLCKLDAENCESLERLDLSFRNPDTYLNFANCIKLNQEARDLIFHTPTTRYAVLPGGEVPVYFTYQASGSCVAVKLNQKPVHASTKFKACILLVNKGEYEVGVWEEESVDCSITSNQNAFTAIRSNTKTLHRILTEHLYIFDFEAHMVTSTDLVFEFKLHTNTITDTLEIKECGIVQL